MNSILYFEIQADQPDRAIYFYERVFGWKYEKQEGVPIEYWAITTKGIGGGLYKRPVKAPLVGSSNNAFICSIQVKDYDTTMELILENGGQIAMDKFAVPGKCWQGYFLDTEGNTFGIFEVDENAGK